MMTVAHPTAEQTVALIARALKGVRTHSVDDVACAIEEGRMQLWTAAHSICVTEIQVFPRCRELCLFLAAGDLRELRDLLPDMLAFGKEQGCTAAFLVGRHGWSRSFLAKQGWREAATVMEVET